MYRLEALPLSHRLTNVFISYSSYMWKLAYPRRLAAFYPYPAQYPVGEVVGCVALVCSISLLAARLWRSGYVLVGWLWFVTTLVPVIGFVQVGRQAMADRYSYIPSIGITMAVVWGCWDFSKGSQVRLLCVWLSAAAFGIVCGAASHRQIANWKSPLALWRHAVAVTGDNYVGYSLIGALEMKDGHYDEAVANFERAVHIVRPVAVRERIGLGVALTKSGRPRSAIEPLREAVLLQPTNLDARTALGVALLLAGRTNEALSNFVFAARRDPSGQRVGDTQDWPTGGTTESLVELLWPAHPDRRRNPLR